jgi:hypothetical protein
VSQPAPSNIQLADCASENATENSTSTSTCISADEFHDFLISLPRKKKKKKRRASTREEHNFN